MSLGNELLNVVTKRLKAKPRDIVERQRSKISGLPPLWSAMSFSGREKALEIIETIVLKYATHNFGGGHSKPLFEWASSRDGTATCLSSQDLGGGQLPMKEWKMVLDQKKKKSKTEIKQSQSCKTRLQNGRALEKSYTWNMKNLWFLNWKRLSLWS